MLRNFSKIWGSLEGNQDHLATSRKAIILSGYLNAQDDLNTIRTTTIYSGSQTTLRTTWVCTELLRYNGDYRNFSGQPRRTKVAKGHSTQPVPYEMHLSTRRWQTTFRVSLGSKEPQYTVKITHALTITRPCEDHHSVFRKMRAQSGPCVVTQNHKKMLSKISWVLWSRMCLQDQW